jgi:hypothetical protein
LNKQISVLSKEQEETHYKILNLRLQLSQNCHQLARDMVLSSEKKEPTAISEETREQFRGVSVQAANAIIPHYAVLEELAIREACKEAAPDQKPWWLCPPDVSKR